MFRLSLLLSQLVYIYKTPDDGLTEKAETCSMYILLNKAYNLLGKIYSVVLTDI
jgi:hypothetical protein